MPILRERTYELLEGYDFVRKNTWSKREKIDDVMEQLPTAFAGLERERKVPKVS